MYRLLDSTQRFALALALAFAAPTLHAQQPLKVFISVDMEGVAGVVSNEQLGPTGFEYQRFREFMTAEAVAAIDGARAAGATEIVIADSHGNMQNLLIERLPDDAMVERTTAHSIRYTATSILDIARFLAFIGTFTPDIDP